VAGPWFTVQTNGEWTRLDTIWVSDGQTNITAKAELRVQLVETNDE